jgi:hypothetical protein
VTIGYIDRHDFTKNIEFVERTRVAVMTYGLTVQGEPAASPPAPERDLKRQALATTILNEVPLSDGLLTRFCWAVVCTYTTGNLGSDDALLLTLVTAVFNDLAGVTAVDG